MSFGIFVEVERQREEQTMSKSKPIEQTWGIMDYLAFSLFFLLLILFIFRSLIFNFTTNLLDWNDYPLFVWIISQNIAHMGVNIFGGGFFDSNIFYPFKGTLLFSDLFLPVSILGCFVRFFTSNPIAIFNSIFITTCVVNVISGFYLWKNFFTSKWILFFAVLATAFSPFVFLNSVHFQIFSIWPILFSLAFLLRKDFKVRNAIIVGIFIALQFLMGLYYGIFLLFAVAIWYCLRYWEFRRSKANYLFIVRHLIVVFATFSILAGFFVFKYVQVKNAYNITRAPWEYVLYAAQPTDYIFAHYGSLISRTSPIERWNAFDKHPGSSAGFPGITLLGLGILGLFYLRRKDQIISLGVNLDTDQIFFVILMAAGLVFSLGPRLSVNGTYTGIPLPYYPVLKLIPLFEPIRVSGRWSLFFYLGLVYFACLGMKKLLKANNKSVLMPVFLSVIYMFEIVPIYKPTEAKQYYPPVYDLLAERCKVAPRVLLEYPMTQDKKDANIVTNLSYRTQMMLASLNHKCNIVNGYSGYIPTDYERYENELFTAVANNDEKSFWTLLRQRRVDLIKLNEREIYEDKMVRIVGWLGQSPKVKVLFDKEGYLVAEVF